jgi:hypothetical protein
LIETLTDDDLDTEVTITKGDLATLIQMVVAKECIQKCEEAARADNADNNLVILDVDKNEDVTLDVDEEIKFGNPEQPLEENATNGGSFYSNRSVIICNQEIT